MAAHDTQISDTATAAWSTPQKAQEGRTGMAVTIVLEEDPYRLITDGDGHYAVIEARNGLVYLSLSRLNHWLPRCQADPEVMQSTADFHYDITDALLPQAALTTRQRLTLLLTCSIRSRREWVGSLLRR
jgi:hypothetical protein